MSEFKIGDKVSYLGWVGKVAAIHPNTDYPVACVFKDESGTVEESFTTDGRLDIKHNKAALIFVERHKKVKKKLQLAIFLTKKDNSFYIPPRLFENEAQAVEAAEHTTTSTFIQFLEDRAINIEL